MEEPGIDDSELNGPKVIGKKSSVEIKCIVCKKTTKTKIRSHPQLITLGICGCYICCVSCASCVVCFFKVPTWAVILGCIGCSSFGLIPFCIP